MSFADEERQRHIDAQREREELSRRLRQEYERRDEWESKNRERGQSSSSSNSSGGRKGGWIVFGLLAYGAYKLGLFSSSTTLTDVTPEAPPSPQRSSPERNDPGTVEPVSLSGQGDTLNYGGYEPRALAFFRDAGMGETDAAVIAEMMNRALVSLPPTRARQVQVAVDHGEVQTFAMAAEPTREGSYPVLFCFSGAGNLVFKQSEGSSGSSLADVHVYSPQGVELDLSSTIAFETNSCRALFSRLNHDFGYLPYVNGAVDVTQTMNRETGDVVR